MEINTPNNGKNVKKGADFMCNRFVKILSIFFIGITLGLNFYNVYASEDIFIESREGIKVAEADPLGLGDLSGYKGIKKTSITFNQKLNKIFIVIRSIGIVVSVIIIMSIGIKYMYSSVEEKAEFKKTMWPYLIGAFIVFSGTALPSIIYKAFAE